MNYTNVPARHILLCLTAMPVVAFAAYVSWLIVPEVVRVVVPEVVRSLRRIVN